MTRCHSLHISFYCVLFSMKKLLGLQIHQALKILNVHIFCKLIVNFFGGSKKKHSLFYKSAQNSIYYRVATSIESIFLKAVWRKLILLISYLRIVFIFKNSKILSIIAWSFIYIYIGLNKMSFVILTNPGLNKWKWILYKKWKHTWR